MLQLASLLPEFPVVIAMRGVGDSLGPQLMAEIGDVTRFAHRGSIIFFAGADPGADQSGTHEAKSVRTSKSGPPELRKALFLVTVAFSCPFLPPHFFIFLQIPS